MEIGLNFINVDDKQTEALIAMAFSDSSAWNQPEVEPGIFRSLWSVFRVYRMVLVKSRASHRRYLRSPYKQDCRLVFRDRIVGGRLARISPAGVSVNFPGTADLVGEEGTLYVDTFVLKAHRKWAIQCEGTVMAGFTIERVEKGAEQWRRITAHAA